MKEMPEMSIESEEEAPTEGEEVLVPEDVETPVAMQEHVAEQEKMADVQFELVREFPREETEQLVAFSEKGTEKQRSFADAFKKITAVAALVMTLGSAGKAYGEQHAGGHLNESEKMEDVQKETFGLSSQSLSEQRTEQQGQFSWESVRRLQTEVLGGEVVKTQRAIEENVSDKEMQFVAQAWVRSIGNQFAITEEMAHQVVGRAHIQPQSNIDSLIETRRQELFKFLRDIHSGIVVKGNNFDFPKFWEMKTDLTPEEELTQRQNDRRTLLDAYSQG